MAGILEKENIFFRWKHTRLKIVDLLWLSAVKSEKNERCFFSFSALLVDPQLSRKKREEEEEAERKRERK